MEIKIWQIRKRCNSLLYNEPIAYCVMPVQYKMTAVHIACKEGHVEMLELFLDYNNSWRAQGLLPPKILDTTDLGDKVNSTLFFVEFGNMFVIIMVIVWFCLIGIVCFLLLISMCAIWSLVYFAIIFTEWQYAFYVGCW